MTPPTCQELVQALSEAQELLNFHDGSPVWLTALLARAESAPLAQTVMWYDVRKELPTHRDLVHVALPHGRIEMDRHTHGSWDTCNGLHDLHVTHWADPLTHPTQLGGGK